MAVPTIQWFLRAAAVAAVLGSSSGCAWLARVSDHGGDGDSGKADLPVLSADGRYVAYRTTGGGGSVQLRDTHTGTTQRIDVTPGGAGSPGADSGPSISGDGRYVVFSSAASDLVDGDTNGVADVFVRDVVEGTTTLVSVDHAGGLADGPSSDARIADGGRYVVFTSSATDLLAAPVDGVSAAYVRDLQTGTTTLASVDTEGNPVEIGWRADVSDDGRYVAFAAYADGIVPEDDNNLDDIFVRDLVDGTTELVSGVDDGTIAQDYSVDPEITPDGRYVAFESPISHMTAVFSVAYAAVWVRDLVDDVTLMGSSVDGPNNRLGITADGSHVLLATAGATDRTPDDFLTFKYAESEVRPEEPPVRSRQLPYSSAIIQPAEFYDSPPGGAASADGRFFAFPSTAHLDSTLPDDHVQRIYVARTTDLGVSSVSPPSLAPGTTTTVTLTGAGFDVGLGVDTVIDGPPRQVADGITVGAVTVLSRTVAEVELTVAPGAPLGARTIQLSLPSPGPWVIGDGGGCTGCLTVTG